MRGSGTHRACRPVSVALPPFPAPSGLSSGPVPEATTPSLSPPQRGAEWVVYAPTYVTVGAMPCPPLSPPQTHCPLAAHITPSPPRFSLPLLPCAVCSMIWPAPARLPATHKCAHTEPTKRGISSTCHRVVLHPPFSVVRCILLGFLPVSVFFCFCDDHFLWLRTVRTSSALAALRLLEPPLPPPLPLSRLSAALVTTAASLPHSHIPCH